MNLERLISPVLSKGRTPSQTGLDQGGNVSRRLSSAYVVRQKDGPYVTDLHLLRLRNAVPELAVTKTAGGVYLALKEPANRTLFDDDLAPSTSSNIFVSEVARPLVGLSNSELKQKVYMTRPMREILRRERKDGELLYNSPVNFAA